MKTLRILVLLLLVLALSGTTISAAGTYISVLWWSQPDPNNPDWAENKDGSMTATNIGEQKVTSIAYVPTGFDAIAGPGAMPGDFTWEFDLTVPKAEDTGDGWAGFYVRASQPQTGAGGYLVHINSNGLAILDGENNVPIIEERILPELVQVGEYNHVKVACAGKAITIWLNGKVAYNKANTAGGSGYLGFSCVNSKASYRNSVFTAADKTEKTFTVAGTEWKGENEPVGATPTAEPTTEGQPSATPTTVASPEPTVTIEEPGDGDGADESGFPVWAIVLVVVIVLAGAGAAGYAFATKKP